jgi:ELWxxDGT repeat protein
MKAASLRCWSETLRNAKRAGPGSCARRRRQLLGLEALEDRITLSLTPQMVLDINSITLNSGGAGVVIGSTHYFGADDGTHGTELWRSDGTAAGTVLVKDITPGTNGSYPGYLTDVNGTLFFSARDDAHGFELWRSDGTAAGTVLVKDIYAGVADSNLRSLTNVNGTVLFVADDGKHGFELWKSNGTAAGTTLVKDIFPGTHREHDNSGNSWNVPNSSNLGNLTNVNGTLFFSADDGVHGKELWKSDGTSTGTVLVEDILPTSTSSDPGDLIDVNGVLFFTAYNYDHGRELWRSDGTAAGTVLVKDINPRNDDLYIDPGSYPDSLTNVNGTLFFSALDGYGGGLWKSDGTEAGTVLVKGVYPLNLTNVNGTLFFTADYYELWKSDGSAAGTVLVKDNFFPTEGRDHNRSLTNVNGTLFFSVNDGTNGQELWKSDGSAAGTVLVKDINPGSTSSFPGGLRDLNGTLFFTADDGAHGGEVWRSDGTAAGTVLIKDINTNTSGSYPGYLTIVNGTLFFTTYGGTNGRELWKSDGTAAGTVLVSSLDWYAGNLTNVNGTLFYTTDDGTHGTELWKSDGTTTGTTLVKDLFPGGYTDWYGGYHPYASNPSNLTNVNGSLFFSAADATGRHLWKSDGTATGTVALPTLDPHNLTNVNGTLFFSAYEGTGTTGYELWKSDGTAAGTVLVKDINPFWPSSYPSNLTNVNGTLFFSAKDRATGIELWKSDGTEAGTVLVKDIFPGGYPDPNSSGPSNLTNVNGTLFFSAFDGWTHGWGLWKSDGAEAGTVLLKDTDPGNEGDRGGPKNLTNVNGTLFFAADDEILGYELPKLWTSDGTAAGTVIFADMPCSSLTNVNGTLFFAADDGFHGWELWKLVEDTAPAPPTVSINDVTVVEGTSGTRAAMFTVTLSAASTQPVTVSFATANGTATARSDYKAASGTLTFAPGETTKTITILVKGDRLGEPDETFFVNLSAATNATIDDGQGLGTILDDEPRIRISDVTKRERGADQATRFVFTVTLSAAYDQAVTVSFETVNGTAKVGDADYVGTTGTLTFRPGETTKQVRIVVRGDNKKESNETFYVRLFGKSSDALFAKRRGVGTILDDEPRIRISDVTKRERGAGQATRFVFTVTLSAASDHAVTMSFKTVNGTATTNDGDYGANNGTLTFRPGETSKKITILVSGDSVKESDEVFYLDLFGNSSNSRFARKRGIGTILNDD